MYLHNMIVDQVRSQIWLEICSVQIHLKRMIYKSMDLIMISHVRHQIAIRQFTMQRTILGRQPVQIFLLRAAENDGNEYAVAELGRGLVLGNDRTAQLVTGLEIGEDVEGIKSIERMDQRVEDRSADSMS